MPDPTPEELAQRREAILRFLRLMISDDADLAHQASQFNGTNWWSPSTGLLDFDEDDRQRQDIDQAIMPDGATAHHVVQHDPDRVLREVAGKRVLIAALEEIVSQCYTLAQFLAVERALLAMAAAYAGFEESWSPDWPVLGESEGNTRLIDGELGLRELG